MSLLLQHLKDDQRPLVQQEALHGLQLLAAECAHLWPAGAVDEVVQIADNSSSQAVLSRCLGVLQVLAKSSAACHSHLCHGKTSVYPALTPDLLYSLLCSLMFKIQCYTFFL